MTGTAQWSKRHSAGLALFAAGLVLVGVASQPGPMLWAWIVTMLLIAGCASVIGQGIKGRWIGLLIDERNMISLSRLQMASGPSSPPQRSTRCSSRTSKATSPRLCTLAFHRSSCC